MADSATPSPTSDSLSSAISTALSSVIGSLADASSTIAPSSSSSSTSARPAPTSVSEAINEKTGSAQIQQGVSLETFLASLSVAAIVFGVEVVLFVLLRKKMKRVYEPRTYLVPEKYVSIRLLASTIARLLACERSIEQARGRAADLFVNRRRTPSPAAGFLNFFGPVRWRITHLFIFLPRWWLIALKVFETATSDFISKSGLDAYFFLRYLLMLLKTFTIVALAIIPVLIPINFIGGRGGKKVQGLDRLAWSNVAPNHTGRYWAHLLLALSLILVFCCMFYDEMRKYIRMRQAYLTSPQHRLKASATTVLVSAIPNRWLTIQQLVELYDAFPGGIRNVWINRWVCVVLFCV